MPKFTGANQYTFIYAEEVDHYPTIMTETISNHPRYNYIEIPSLDANLVDYNDDFDVYYNSSDDGSEFWHNTRILEDGKEYLTPPTFDDIRDASATLQSEIIHKMYRKYEQEDVGYALNIITNPVWLHKDYNEQNGDLDKAQRAALNRVFTGVF